MHIGFLVEDSSGALLVETLLARVLGAPLSPHSWRVHAYKGVGHLPRGLAAGQDPAKRALLDRLPKLLAGYGKTRGTDAVVVVLDADKRDCQGFLKELKAVLNDCDPAPVTLFRLAIEDIEAWQLGDQPAILKAYPRAKRAVFNRYTQDSVCGTWEVLADAVHQGGAASARKAGWPLPGQLKHEWADRIGPHMNVEANRSPSFQKFRDGVRRLVENPRSPTR